MKTIGMMKALWLCSQYKKASPQQRKAIQAARLQALTMNAASGCPSAASPIKANRRRRKPLLPRPFSISSEKITNFLLTLPFRGEATILLVTNTRRIFLWMNHRSALPI